MSSELVIGQLIVCICVLVVLTVVIFLFGSGKRRSVMMQNSAGFALAAVGLRFRSYGYLSSVDNTAKMLGCGTMAALAIAAAAASLFIKGDRFSASVNWLSLAIMLSPVWLSALYGVITGDYSFTWSGVTLSVLTAWFIYSHDAEKELQKTAEQIERQQAVLLQEQMRPHFLFNSLGAIRQLCDSDHELAKKGILDLSGYLRKNLDALASDELIPFSKELEHIKEYTALEMLNPDSKYEVLYDLKTIDFYLPALSVQPLVENAIHHGVRSMGEDGTVIVSTERLGDAIKITVEDNGSGFPDSATDKQRERVSRGLDNLRKRLESLCGGSLHINSDQSGTKVVVLIPNCRRVDSKNDHDHS